MVVQVTSLPTHSKLVVPAFHMVAQDQVCAAVQSSQAMCGRGLDAGCGGGRHAAAAQLLARAGSTRSQAREQRRRQRRVAWQQAATPQRSDVHRSPQAPGRRSPCPCPVLFCGCSISLWFTVMQTRLFGATRPQPRARPCPRRLRHVKRIRRSDRTAKSVVQKRCPRSAFSQRRPLHLLAKPMARLCVLLLCWISG